MEDNFTTFNFEEFNPYAIDDFVKLINKACAECLDLLGIKYTKCFLTETHISEEIVNLEFVVNLVSTRHLSHLFSVRVPFKFRQNIMFIKGAFYTRAEEVLKSSINNLGATDTTNINDRE